MAQVQDLYLFMAVFDGEDTATPVAKAIATAAREEKVHVDGLAAVHRDEHGHVHLHEIGDITGSQGAVRGAAVGAVLGLIFPPSILGTAILGSAVGAVVAKFHDKGFSTGDLHAVGESLDKGQSAVLFVGDDSAEVDLATELKDASKVSKEPAPADLPDKIAAADSDS